MTVPHSIEIMVPQMGEGLREVRILTLLRKVGDVVRRDELLYSMETDKANVDVESPEDGILQEWLTSEGEVVPVGSPIARFSPVVQAGAPASFQPEVALRNGNSTKLPAGQISGSFLMQDGVPVNGDARGQAQGPEPVPDVLSISGAGGLGSVLPAGAEKRKSQDSHNYRPIPDAGDDFPSERNGRTGAGPSSPSHSSGSSTSLTAVSTPVRVPPRTAAYCRQHGIGEEVVRRIPARGSSLTIKDVNDFLHSAATDDSSASGFRDVALSESQANLKFHLERSHVSMVPAIVKTTVPWALIDSARSRVRATESVDLSHFQIFAYCVARATIDHPKFRSRLLEKNIVRQYDHVNLGFAVALPNDDLVTAVVRDADTVALAQFGRAMMRQLREARRGRDQAAQDTQMTLSHMPDQDVIDGIPVLVSPMVATLFLGTHYRAGEEDVVNLVLCFDHRLINGVGAGKFLKTVAENLKLLGP